METLYCYTIAFKSLKKIIPGYLKIQPRFNLESFIKQADPVLTTVEVFVLFFSLNTGKITENIYVLVNRGLIWPNAYDSCHLYVQQEQRVLYIENRKSCCGLDSKQRETSLRPSDLGPDLVSRSRLPSICNRARLSVWLPSSPTIKTPSAIFSKF